MENLQAGAIASAGLISAWSMVADGGRWPRWYSFALFTFFLGLLLRELDVERLPLPQALIAIGSGQGRTFLIGGLVVICLVWLFREFSALRRVLGDFFRSGTVWYIGFGIGLYLLGDLFDQKVIQLGKQTNLFFEEIFENGGTFFFLIASLFQLNKERFGKESA